MSNVNKYAQYLAEQEKRNVFNSSKEVNVRSFRSYVTEAAGEDKSVTQKVAKHDQDAIHVGSVGHEHVYAGEQPDHETHVYHVHNSKTGQTHTADIEHAGEAFSHSEVHSQFGGKVSKAASKIAHKDHKDEMNFHSGG